MPKTSVDKNDRAEPTYHYVWLTRQTLHMQTIPEAMRIKIFPNPQFGLGILGMNVAHALVALLWGHLVWHIPFFLKTNYHTRTLLFDN